MSNLIIIYPLSLACTMAVFGKFNQRPAMNAQINAGEKSSNAFWNKFRLGSE